MKIHHDFINKNIKTVFNSIDPVLGKPCCSYETMNKVAKELKDFLNTIDKDYRYVYRNTRGLVLTYAHLDYLDYDAVKDLVEYINILNDNRFVMWFSW